MKIPNPAPREIRGATSGKYDGPEDHQRHYGVRVQHRTDTLVPPGDIAAGLEGSPWHKQLVPASKYPARLAVES